ncbi:MAG: hypothetical protein WDM89_00010 [Rhizomicrobium sp.]
MAAVEAQKKDLQEKIDTEVGRLTESISNDLVVARAQVGSLQGSLSQAEKQAGNQKSRAREAARAAIDRAIHAHDV